MSFYARPSRQAVSFTRSAGGVSHCGRCLGSVTTDIRFMRLQCSFQHEFFFQFPTYTTTCDTAASTAAWVGGLGGRPEPAGCAPWPAGQAGEARLVTTSQVITGVVTHNDA